MISLKNTLEAIKTKLSAHDKALSVDYIVEQGTSGIWTYRKWNSGIAECWGVDEFYHTSWAKWNPTGLYYSVGNHITNYPFSFSTIQNAQVRGDYWVSAFYANASASSITTVWMTDTSSARTIKASIYIKGTYK